MLSSMLFQEHIKESDVKVAVFALCSSLLLGLCQSICAAPALSVPTEVGAKEGDRPLQHLRLPDEMGWYMDYNLNEDIWTLKNITMAPRQGSYATGTVYIQRFNDVLPRQADQLSQTVGEAGALASGFRFDAIDKIDKVQNGFVIYGKEVNEMDPLGRSYASFVMVRHLNGLNILCRQGDAGDLADPTELVKLGVEICRQLTR
jgi:hypothetical protein